MMRAMQPNILLLIAHDLGCHIGPYGLAKAASPNLMKLAAQGMRLDAHFVTSPGCSQSRSSLVTGRYPHANGQFGLAHLGWTLNRDEILLPAVLREAGYRTALTGIWHLHEWTLDAFDDVADDASTRDSSPEGFAEVASHRAAAWLREKADQGKPFYLHVGFWETHRPAAGQEVGLNPHVLGVIGEHLTARLDSLRLHASQGCPAPHARSAEALRSLAVWRGSVVLLPAAEAFVVVREGLPAGVDGP